MVSSFCFCHEKTSFVYLDLDPPSVSSSGVWTFVLLVLESAGTTTASSIREICEKIWKIPYAKFAKYFEMVRPRNYILAKVSNFRGWNDPRNLIPLTLFTKGGGGAL